MKYHKVLEHTWLTISLIGVAVSITTMAKYSLATGMPYLAMATAALAMSFIHMDRLKASKEKKK
jgi:hypothetical protein